MIASSNERGLLVLAVVVCAAIPAAARAAAPSAASTLGMTASGSLQLDGDSTLHRYSAKTHDLRALFKIDGTAAAAGAATREKVEALIRGRHLKSFELAVTVDTLKSGDSGLDTNMRKALKSDKFKEIRFQMESYEVRPSSAAGAAFTVAMQGRLTVAGVQKPVEVIVNAFDVAGGLRIAGSKDLLMTDYQIKPPTMMLGTIKTKNLITVKFDVQLRSAA